MSVWLAIPSKKVPAEAEVCLGKWREMGYRIALWRDTGDEPIPCNVLLTGQYPGYYAAVNALCREILANDPKADWIVAAGDDMDPDYNRIPEDIAQECSEHFGGTFGVMQPTGDRWGHQGRVYAEHICGSPWLGREFCRRMYGGRGPYDESYRHMFGDESLMCVAIKLGVLWQRPDIVQYHHHWGREGRPMPGYLRAANAGFTAEQQIFFERRAKGFPGHEPIPE